MLDYSREFKVLACHLNFTSAALELNLSQPSLSRHIAELESEVGFQLLERNPVKLTKAGRYYLEAITSIIEKFDLAIRHGRTIAQEDNRPLSLCMIPWDTPYADVIYESIVRMRDSDPDFSVNFYADRSRSIVDTVNSGNADIGVLLCSADGLPEGFICEWLMDVHFSAFLHERDPLLDKLSIGFEDLEGYNIVFSTNLQYRTWLDGMRNAYRKRGMESKYHLKDLDSIVDFMIELNVGEVLFRSDTNKKLCKYDPHLAEVKFDDPECFYSVYLLYNEDMANSSIRRFTQMCHRVVEECFR